MINVFASADVPNAAVYYCATSVSAATASVGNDVRASASTVPAGVSVSAAVITHITAYGSGSAVTTTPASGSVVGDDSVVVLGIILLLILLRELLLLLLLPLLQAILPIAVFLPVLAISPRPLAVTLAPLEKSLKGSASSERQYWRADLRDLRTQRIA